MPSIEKGNDDSHAIGLGQMNLHGYLARERIFYGSEEGIDFTNIYFYTVRVPRDPGIQPDRRSSAASSFKGFAESKYASGEYFDKYTEQEWAAGDRAGARICSPSAGITSRRRTTGPR